MEIMIKEIKTSFDKIKHEINIQGIKFEWKLNKINIKIINQLEMRLIQNEIAIQKTLLETQDQIRSLKIQIKRVKSLLPSPTSICNTLKTCGKCTANPGCGWCSSSQSCIEGNEKGPYIGKCTFYDYKLCISPKPCKSYKTCNTCIQDVTCGWCNDLYSSNTTCMSKKEAEIGNCRNEQFIHQWKSKELHKCPHITMVII